jgi:hypothetical protein
MEKLEISKTEAKALLSLAKKLGVVESSIPVQPLVEALPNLNFVEVAEEIINEVDYSDSAQFTQDEIGNFVPVQPSVETVEPSVQNANKALAKQAKKEFNQGLNRKINSLKGIASKSAKAGDMVTASQKLQEAMELTPSHWTSVQQSVIAKAKELGFTTSA